MIPRRVPGWTSPEEEFAKTRAYEDALLARYVGGLPLTRLDRRDARRIAKVRFGVKFEKKGTVQ